MNKPLDLMLPEDWKQRTRVFVTRKTSFQAMTPMVSKKTYEAEREGSEPSMIATLTFTLTH
jgi:hypothetical protein